ncbi:MAG: universal stress protein [Rhizobiales bacterium]|nr:universal stress protein [Hyphomicrobiales bacterium]MDQ3558924.1 universal stress protein [Pseudomonadota bacterium]
MMAPRRSRDEGHKRKFLVVIDDTPECLRALSYAARRAAHTSGAVVLLFVVEPEAPQSWLGVEDIMRAEALEQARATLAKFAARARDFANLDPEMVIREGRRAEEIRKLIEADEDIAILVLAAGESSEGPGPLVTAIAARGSGTFPVPITIVPATLSEEELDAIA